MDLPEYRNTKMTTITAKNTKSVKPRNTIRSETLLLGELGALGG